MSLYILDYNSEVYSSQKSDFTALGSYFLRIVFVFEKSRDRFSFSDTKEFHGTDTHVGSWSLSLS
jgi:hypothetical protein